MTMSELRLLMPEEVPLVLPLAREFFATGEIPGKLNEVHFVNLFRKQLAEGNAFIIAAGIPLRGMIAGFVHQDPFDGQLVCGELWWFVRKEERGSLGLRLFNAWEAEAKSRGAVRFQMAHLTGSKTDSLDRLFERKGYIMKEKIFVKEVNR